jgi:hypothetical protein
MRPPERTVLVAVEYALMIAPECEEPMEIMWGYYE